MATTSESTPVERIPPLAMVHACLIQANNTFPFSLVRSYGFVGQNSKMYRRGGWVRRLHNGQAKNSTYFDVMVCAYDDDQCFFCRQYDPLMANDSVDGKIAREAENGDDVPNPEHSGRPMIHRSDIEDGKDGLTFNPELKDGIGKTATEDIVEVMFGDTNSPHPGGTICPGKRSAVLCNEGCPECLRDKEYRASVKPLSDEGAPTRTRRMRVRTTPRRTRSNPSPSNSSQPFTKSPPRPVTTQSRPGKKWSQAEEQSLITMYRQNLPFKVIAEALGRPSDLACRMNEDKLKKHGSGQQIWARVNPATAYRYTRANILWTASRLRRSHRFGFKIGNGGGTIEVQSPVPPTPPVFLSGITPMASI